MARPSKRTPAVEKAIMDALRAGSTRTAAFEAAGVERTQMWRWMNRFAAFRNAVLQAEAQAELTMTVRLRQLADGGSVTAVMFWLERRRREDWGRYERIDVTTIVDELAEEHNFTPAEARAAADEADRWLRAYRRRHG